MELTLAAPNWMKVMRRELLTDEDVWRLPREAGPDAAISANPASSSYR